MSVVFAVLLITMLYLMRTFVFSKEVSSNIRYDSVLCFQYYTNEKEKR